MKFLFTAVLFFISLPTLAEEPAPKAKELVAIEDYQFEFEQVGSGKLSGRTGGESEGISYHSVTLIYKLKQDNIDESPTLLASIDKKAEDKCKQVAGSEYQGDIVYKTEAVAPWQIVGRYLCALK